jgi:SAM-dependent methyltransferase
MELQLDWDIDRLKHRWAGPDTAHVIARVSELSPQVTAEGGPRRVLEVAAAEAVHACKLSVQGMETFVVEPSPSMIERARARMTEFGAQLVLIRGVAETLPFRDRTFDRVLLDSAIDHLGEPERGIREMTRVLRPDGRLVISFVNYESLSVRLSRRLYAVARRLGLSAPDGNLFWDTPVPLEHTFECTYPLLSRMCGPYLQLDRAFGVSIGWMVPGWAALLKRLPPAPAEALMRGLDRVAHRAPRMADFIVTVWRPRPNGAAAAPAAPRLAAAAERAVSARDLLYPSRSRAEAEFWARTDFRGGFYDLARPASGDALERRTNAAYTGDPTRSWIDDLIARGPFVAAAALGCDHGSFERHWVARGGSTTLDVYDLSAGVIRKVRAGLGLGWTATHGPQRRVRFIRTDLNFARLPENRYDVIWSSGCLHHIIELEHLFAEVERALRPGGLFAIRDYVGERRMQFAPARLARINAVLQDVPPRYRRAEALLPAPLSSLSPFCGVRSDAILPLAEARFDVVHEAMAGALFPLTFAIDFAAIEREAPDVLARLLAAEEEALRDPTVRPCGVYAVLRKRATR